VITGNPGDDTIDWQFVWRMNGIIDTGAGLAYQSSMTAAIWGRIGKIGEEYGEVTAALIGATGQNFRKGYTHDMSDVIAELADVTLTAILAMQHLRGNTSDVREALQAQQRYIAERAGIVHDPDWNHDKEG
jgi:phosphoribosyl-ATP pyrophosphohydrolase